MTAPHPAPLPDKKSPLPDKAHWDTWYIYLQSVGIALAVWYYSYNFYNDDAYISLVYARNLMQGNGLSWNIGDNVEGYSNFFFVILCAGLGYLGMDLVFASKLLGFTGFFALLAIAAKYSTWHSPSPPYRNAVARALFVGLLGSSVPLVAWCLGGLESTLYAAFILAGVCITCAMLSGRVTSQRLPLLGALCFSLASLTRPDGAIFTFYTLAALTLAALLDQQKRVRMKQVLAMAAPYIAVFAAYNIWRYNFFGDWLPNTYYAKAYLVDKSYIFTLGLRYLISYLLIPPFLPVIAVVLFIAALRARALSLSSWYLAGFLALGAAYVVKVGGDWMPYGRFIVPFIPIMALLIYHCSMEIMPTREKLFRDLCGALLAFSFLQFAIVEKDKNQTVGTISSLIVKDHIETHWPQGSLIALNPAGYFPYISPGYRYLDMLGLTDRVIARRAISPEIIEMLDRPAIGHIKGDGARVLELKPDYIVFHHMWGNSRPEFLSDRELAESPEFRAQYEQVEVYVDVPEDLKEHLPLYLQTQEIIKKVKKTEKEEFGLKMNDAGTVRFVYFKRKT